MDAKVKVDVIGTDEALDKEREYRDLIYRANVIANDLAISLGGITVEQEHLNTINCGVTLEEQSKHIDKVSKAIRGGFD